MPDQGLGRTFQRHYRKAKQLNTFRPTLVRVMAVQVVTLLALWLLELRYNP